MRIVKINGRVTMEYVRDNQVFEFSTPIDQLKIGGHDFPRIELKTVFPHEKTEFSKRLYKVERDVRERRKSPF